MADIRRACETDIDAIACIESVAGFNQWSKKQLNHSIDNEFVWVVEQRQKVLAFAIFTHVIDESELLNIVVLPEMQGKGIAKSLMQFALQQLVSEKVVKCLLEVAVSNVSAIRLYKKLKFKEITVRKNYYSRPCGKEDALIMQLELVNENE